MPRLVRQGRTICFSQAVRYWHSGDIQMTRIVPRLACLALTLAAGAGARADTLADIKAKGELVVGTKADYPPYGFRDKSGEIVGIEPDLAADIARRLGVKVRIEPVQSSNRIQFLQQGK